MTRIDFRDLIVAELSEEFAYSYFDRSVFVLGARPVLHPWSGIAQERWRTMGRPFLQKHGVELGHRMAVGAWRERMAAE